MLSFPSVDASEDVGSGALALVNGSPRHPRIQAPSFKDQESFDITLHRKDNEGFGFVILTSKSKPPLGGKRRSMNQSFFDNNKTHTSHIDSLN